MICRIEALRYRCLRYLRQEIGPFQVLVGANATGKTTFLDVVAFLHDLLTEGLATAVEARTHDFHDLLWCGEGDRIELAVEAAIPPDRRERLPRGENAQPRYVELRYEVAVGLDADQTLAILGETLWLKPEPPNERWRQPTLFPSPPSPPERLVHPENKRAPQGWRQVVSKKPSSGNDYFRSETGEWNNLFRLGPRKLALANLPEDEERFPVATWFKRLLGEGTRRIVLDSRAMREPAPTGSSTTFLPDGSNLPRVAEALEREPDRFARWVAHVRTALPDIKSIATRERPEDRRRYLVVEHFSGHVLPSWAVSDGTLRLLALTLLAYADPPGGPILVEEPENGIHPQAVETVFQALSTAHGRQILCASHSPVMLSLADPAQLLCFAKTADGATDVVLGTKHPRLVGWQGEVDLGTLFGAGVLG